MQIVHVAETPSTNDEAKRLLAGGAGHGTVVLADRQTGGRGRLGRSWLSPEGNLYMSVVLRHRLGPERVPLLSLAAAVAVAESVPVRLCIKWPNDLLAPDGRKVSGILAESADAGAVVGIGVNLAVAPLAEAACLSELGCDVPRTELATAIAASLVAMCADLERGSEAMLARWRRRATTLGSRVRVGDLEGIAEQVDELGALWVRTSDGVLCRVVAGDVVPVSPRASGSSAP